MKKIIWFLLLMCPIFVGAITYDSAVNLAGNYMTSGDFKYSYTKYIYTPTNTDKFYKSDHSNFRYGGLLSYDEFMITVKNQNSINYSYLYESNAFWTLSNGTTGNKKVIDSVNTEVNTSNSKLRIGAKITEYVLPGAKLIGQGTYNDPFIFAPQYKVSIKVNNSSRGVLVDEAGNEVTSIDFVATESDFREIKIKSKGKYGYIGSTCGLILNDIQSGAGKLVINSVTRDTECTINFGEKPTAVKFDQSDNNKIQVNPEKLYVVPESGWFSDEFGNFSISKLITRPEKLGYTYKGYYKSTSLANACSGTLVVGTDDLLSKDETLLESFTADQVLYPCHTANTYTVTFNLNSGDSFTSGSSTKSVTFDQTYGTLPVPKKTGYTFNGWWTDAEYGDKVESTSFMTTASDHTLYAHWNKDTVTYKIKYCKQKIGGGSAENTTNYPTSDCQTETKYALSDTVLTAPKIDIDGFTKPTVDKTVTVSRFSDTEVYYYYTRNFINISFANSTTPVASPNSYSKSIQFGDSYSFPSISATGYTFAGWWTSTSGGEEKTTSKTVTNPNDHTLYPRFNINKYTITLEKGTGVASVSGAGSFDYNSEKYINATMEAGYLWNGWTGYANTSTQNYRVVIPAQNITFRANAKGVPYTVKYDCNNGGGTVPSSTSHIYGTASAVSTNTCTKSGFAFVNWNTKADGSGTAVGSGANITNLTTTNNGTVTLYAQWKDTSAPSCTLKATADGVSFDTKTDNVGVASYGLIKSTTATYNSSNTVALSTGTFYGYVKDAAGNTNKCSIAIGGTYVTTYSKKTQTCNETFSNYTRTTKTCNRSLSSYDKTVRKCGRSVAKYTRVRKTCNSTSRYNGQGSCTCRTAYNPSIDDNKYVTSGNSITTTPNANNNLAYAIGLCIEGVGCSCPGGAPIVRTNDCKKTTTYSFGGTTTDYPTSCSSNTFSCGSGTVGSTYTSCSVYSYNYSFSSSTSSASSCSVGSSFTCNSSNYNSSYVSSCSANYNYSFGSATATVSSCSVGSSFTCNSSNYGSSYISSCTKNYNYSWTSATSSVGSCSTTSSFTCASGKGGSSYVASCTPTAYACSDSGYTKINNSYCYKK